MSLYADYYYGDALVYSFPMDYAGYYSYWYDGVEFSGPYYVYGGFYSFYYDTWTCYSWWGVSGVYLYGAEDDYAAAWADYSYWYGFELYSWYFGAAASAEYGADYTWGGYYLGDDYTGFALYLLESYGGMYFEDSYLYGADWYVTIGYASSEIEVSYWVEYFATELMEYYYAMY